MKEYEMTQEQKEFLCNASKYNEERFNLHANDIQILDEEGNVVPKNRIKQYLAEKRLKSITVSEKVMIGDRVKTKDDINIYIIVDTNFQGFDYLGKINEEDHICYMFNQGDIESIVSRKNR